MNVAAITLAELRAIDLFDDLDDDELQQWVAVARPRLVEPGEVVAEEGEEPEGVVLLLEGTIQTLLVYADRTEPIGRQRPPTWALAIAVMTGGPLAVRMQAESECRYGLVEAEDFRRLALAHPAVHRRVMQQVAPVMSRVTAVEQNRERLASLGTMAAGLAHELNNPAAAARRAARQLAEAVEVVSSSIGRFVEAGIERAEAEQLVILQREALAAADKRTSLDTLDAADAEDELLPRLQELGVPEAGRVFDPLAAAGLDEAWLQRVATLAGSATDAALAWVAASLTVRDLAAELEHSTERMSDLVGAVKSYAYMDRGGVVELDLHDGLETTLTVLGHKLKHTEIEIVRDYDRDLPRLMLRGSELNQVWTNLLDNAIDAVGERGRITISTRREGDFAAVDVADDGHGIPPEVRERVFDSFFTTKPVGEGTGLGLATARQIVVDRDNGSLTVESEPGRTVFHVRLPIGRPSQAEAPPSGSGTSARQGSQAAGCE
jgi:signal transduction histidine kinase